MAANRKFESRFRSMEDAVTRSGQPISDLDIHTLESHWQATKNS